MRRKQCTKCGKTKSASGFYPQKDVVDGLQSWCKSCKMAYTAEWKRRRCGGTLVDKAMRSVAKSVVDGNLLPISKRLCAGCKKKAEHYHHESYKESEWLVVYPLCQRCHKMYHRIRKAVSTAK